MAPKRKSHKKKPGSKPGSQTSTTSHHPPGSSNGVSFGSSCNAKITPLAVAEAQTPKYNVPSLVRTVPSSLDSTPLTQRSTNLPNASASSIVTTSHNDPLATDSSPSFPSKATDSLASLTNTKPTENSGRAARHAAQPPREFDNQGKLAEHVKKDAEAHFGPNREKIPGKAKKTHKNSNPSSHKDPLSTHTDGRLSDSKTIQSLDQVEAKSKPPLPVSTSALKSEDLAFAEIHQPFVQVVKPTSSGPETAPPTYASPGAQSIDALIGPDCLDIVQPVRARSSLSPVAGQSPDQSKQNEIFVLDSLDSPQSVPQSLSQENNIDSQPVNSNTTDNARAHDQPVGTSRPHESSSGRLEPTTTEPSAPLHASPREFPAPDWASSCGTSEVENRASTGAGKGVLQTKDHARRELSGANDQFDFDAQQREQAGPGGGIVKKARHGSLGPSDQNPRSEPDRDPRLKSEGPASNARQPLRQSEFARETRVRIGHQHAQACLRSVISTRSQSNNVQIQDIQPSLIQIYLSYFDLNQDGTLDPFDTWRAVRRLGFGFVFSTLAAVVGHAVMSFFIGKGTWLLPDLLGRCQLPVGRPPTYQFHGSAYVDPHHFSKTHAQPFQRVGPSAVWQKTRTHMGGAMMIDPFNWLKFVLGWIVVVGLMWPPDLTIEIEEIDGVYNGDLFFLVAQNKSFSGSSRLSETNSGKLAQGTSRVGN